MKFLERERAVLEAFTPGLDAALAAIDFETRESPGSPIMDLFRDSGATNLVLPRALGGMGATALEAVRFQRAIASRSPSLGIATTMHHFKVAMLAELVQGTPREYLIRDIIDRRQLVASCGAEGQGASLFQPAMTVREVDNGLIMRGSKKPCCLSRSMGVLSMLVPSPPSSRYEGKLLIVLIAADSPGIGRRAFWKNSALAGAESEEVVLEEVFVPHEQTVEVGRPGEFLPIFTFIFMWFELLASGSYLGAASGMAERVLASSRVGSAVKARLGIELEAAMSALEGVAHGMMAGQMDYDALARALHVRYGVQGAIDRATSMAAEALGGGAFASSNLVTQLLAGARALAYHPPSLASMEESLATALAGGPLVMP